MPAFVIAANPREQVRSPEIIGLLIWAGAFVIESVLDMQKLIVLQKIDKAGRKVGLAMQACGNTAGIEVSRFREYWELSQTAYGIYSNLA